MSDIVKYNADILPALIKQVEDKIVTLRGKDVIADADVASLYGVETKRVNEAVRNNSDKFPVSYMFELTPNELRDLRSKISSTNVSTMNRNPTKAFRVHFGDKLLHREVEAYGQTCA